MTEQNVEKTESTDNREHSTNSGCPFHPPKAKIYKGQTGLNLLGNKAKEDLFCIFNEKSYGLKMSRQPMIFRDVFLINNPENFRNLIVDMPERVPKSEQMREALKPLIGESIFISNDDIWKRRRALVEPAIKMLTPKRTFYHINAAVEDMLERMQANLGNKFDLEAELSHVTADAIFRAIFSDKLEGEDAQGLFINLQKYQASLPQVSMKGILGLPKWWPGGVSNQGLEYAQNIRLIIRKLIDRRIAKGADAEDDLLGKLLISKDAKGDCLTTDELVDEIGLLFLAGHETTASVLCWTVFLTRMDQTASDLIAQEINSVIREAKITHELFGDLEVSKNLFAEGLRLYPPVPFITRDLTEPTPMRDWLMKKGSLVVVSPWLIHRHRKFWKNPDSFIAKRFARGQKDKVDKRAYLPFGIGERVCPGAAFALMEGPLILASIFQRFEFEIESSPELRPVCRLTTRPSHPIYMRITKDKLGQV